VDIFSKQNEKTLKKAERKDLSISSLQAAQACRKPSSTSRGGKESSVLYLDLKLSTRPDTVEPSAGQTPQSLPSLQYLWTEL
jgi:hypothetical protein